jgi:uncharacterized protein with PQ loop repeat
MNPVTVVGVVASASGVCMALSPWLQVRRIRKLGDASEVSPGVFHTMRVNATIWLVYGLAATNFVIIVPNVVALATTTGTLLTIRRFTRAVDMRAVEIDVDDAHAPATAEHQLVAAGQ